MARNVDREAPQEWQTDYNYPSTGYVVTVEDRHNFRYRKHERVVAIGPQFGGVERGEVVGFDDGDLVVDTGDGGISASPEQVVHEDASAEELLCFTHNPDRISELNKLVDEYVEDR